VDASKNCLFCAEKGTFFGFQFFILQKKASGQAIHETEICTLGPNLSRPVHFAQAEIHSMKEKGLVSNVKEARGSD
jgi:hypothetical protein